MSVDFNLEPPPENMSREERRRRMEKNAIVIRGESPLFNLASWNLFLDRIEDGAGWNDINNDDNLPSWSTLRRWMRDNPDLLEQYKEARDFSADRFEGDIIAMMQELTFDNIDPKTAPLYRLRFDAAKKLMEVRSPKRYGQKTAHDIKTSGDLSVSVPELKRIIIDE